MALVGLLEWGVIFSLISYSLHENVYIYPVDIATQLLTTVTVVFLVRCASYGHRCISSLRSIVSTIVIRKWRLLWSTGIKNERKIYGTMLSG